MATKKKRGPGRPPLPPDAVRSEFLKVRFSTPERGEIEKASRAAGKDLTGWARDTLLAAARR